jgi:hypothetical protein
MARTLAKEGKMVSFMIKQQLADHLPDMVTSFEKSHNNKFTKQETSELIAVGEEIIEAYFPTTSYTFTLNKREMANFDKFIGDFVQAFMGALVSAMHAHMSLAYVMSKVDEQFPDIE